MYADIFEMDIQGYIQKTNLCFSTKYVNICIVHDLDASR